MEKDVWRFRLLFCIGDEVADELVEKLSDRVSSLKIGPGTDTSNEMGPLVSQAHYEKYAAM